MIERLNLYKSQFGYIEPMGPIDESSNACKMYKDFVVPPLPPAYAHLNLPSHWLLHMHCKKSEKRSHKKSGDPVMSFKDLAVAIADAYKKMDDKTKAWLDKLCSKLHAYNKGMRDDLAAFFAENGLEEAEDEDDAVGEKTGEDSRHSIPRNDRISSQISEDLLANERKRILLNLQAARLSLEMKELQELTSITNRIGVINRHGLSPYHGRSQSELSSLLAMQGGHRSLLPLPSSRARPQPNLSQMPEAGPQSLLYTKAPQKRNCDSRDNGTDSNKKGKANPQSTSCNITPQLDEEKVVRAASLDGLPRDSLASVFTSRLPFNRAHAASSLLGSTGGAAEIMNHQLMLGYQLGLRAAAQARAPPARLAAVSDPLPRLTNDEIAARLYALEREARSRESRGDKE